MESLQAFIEHKQYHRATRECQDLEADVLKLLPFAQPTTNYIGVGSPHKPESHFLLLVHPHLSPPK